MPLVQDKLMEILVCPADKAKVVANEKAGVLECPKCGRRYPVRDGVPIMLFDEEEPQAFRADRRKD